MDDALIVPLVHLRPDWYLPTRHSGGNPNHVPKGPKGGQFAPKAGATVSVIGAYTVITNNLPNGKGSKAVDVVAKTHNYPTGTFTTKIVSKKLAEGVDANFHMADNHIEVDPKAKNTTRALLHELGHKADVALSEDGDGLLSHEPEDPDMFKLTKKLYSSKAFRIFKDGPLRDMAAYWTSPHEMFARAYDQWIGERESLPPNAQLAPGSGVSNVDLGIAWSPEDFKPVAAAMESLFKNKGLLK